MLQAMSIARLGFIAPDFHPTVRVAVEAFLQDDSDAPVAES
jgi:hypothetical protein